MKNCKYSKKECKYNKHSDTCDACDSQILNELVNKLAVQSESIPEEFQKVLDDNFVNLL